MSRNIEIEALLAETPDEESFESVALSRKVLKKLRRDLPKYRVRMIFMCVLRLLLVAAAWAFVLLKAGTAPLVYYITAAFVLYALIEAATLYLHLKKIRATLDTEAVKVEHIHSMLREALINHAAVKGR